MKFARSITRLFLLIGLMLGLMETAVASTPMMGLVLQAAMPSCHNMADAPGLTAPGLTANADHLHTGHDSAQIHGGNGHAHDKHLANNGQHQDMVPGNSHGTVANPPHNDPSPGKISPDKMHCCIVQYQPVTLPFHAMAADPRIILSAPHRPDASAPMTQTPRATLLRPPINI
ncbi:MAG: hypothetical protein E2598_03740 [Sphingobium sp.]|nr:hypothetical protein [Sphingobium sp.]